MKRALSDRYLALAWWVVILGTVWISANVAAEIVRVWNPIGDWGVIVDYDGKISCTATCPKGVDPATPVDLSATKPPIERARIVGGSPRVGEVATVALQRAGTSMTLRAKEETPRLPTRITHAVRCAGAALTAWLAVLLFWRRPSRASFGFFLFALGFSPMSQTALSAYAGPWSVIVQSVLNDITEGAGIYGLMMFCEEFGRNVVPIARYFVLMLAVVGGGLTAFADIALVSSGAPSRRIGPPVKSSSGSG